MIGDTTHYFCEHNLRVQVSPFMYICLDTVYNYIMHRDIMYMYMINKLLLSLKSKVEVIVSSLRSRTGACGVHNIQE